MYIFLTLLSGIIITIMTSFNALLSNWCSTYLATLLIHLTGLSTFVVLLKLQRKKIYFRNHLPFLLYSGGIIGILTVIFNVISVNFLGISLITALGLLGQLITSIILEQTGWLCSLKKQMTYKKWASLIVVLAGIGVMLL